MIEAKQSSITVVITSFQRPQWVWRAFESCLNAGVRNIVVSASGCTAEMAAVYARMGLRHRALILDAIEGDFGCNEMWLRGVKRVKTPWVHILHDDDALEPDFLDVESRLNGAGFAMWKSVQKEEDGKEIAVLSNFDEEMEGLYSAVTLMPILLHRGQLAITPVTGLFRREDVVSVLMECERFGPAKFSVRPNMMVGNDLLIWLRAAERHAKFLWFPQVLTRLGYWKGSTTCADESDAKRLPGIYDRMRDYFIENLKNPGAIPQGPRPKFPESRIIHCVEKHTGSAEEEERKRFAFDSWETLYDQKVLIPAHYQDYVRDATSVGETRRLPFLKDVLAFGVSCAQPQDLILLTNDDTIIHPKLPRILNRVMASHGATMAHRCEYSIAHASFLKSNALFVPGTQHWGRDLFCFTVPWLREHWGEIPDFLLGAPFWDLMLALLIRHTLETDILFKTDHMGHSWDWEIPVGYVAHIEHAHVWNNHKPADQYNEELSLAIAQKLHPDKPWGNIIRM